MGEADALAGIDGFPVRYIGFDGVEYLASYKPGDEYRVSRFFIERTDGQPVIVNRTHYPAGYVGGYGDLAAINFLNNLPAKV